MPLPAESSHWPLPLLKDVLRISSAVKSSKTFLGSGPFISAVHRFLLWTLPWLLITLEMTSAMVLQLWLVSWTSGQYFPIPVENPYLDMYCLSLTTYLSLSQQPWYLGHHGHKRSDFISFPNAAIWILGYILIMWPWSFPNYPKTRLVKWIN